MSLDSLIAALAEFAPTLGAFLLAYLVHSTVLFALAWGLTSRRVGLPVHVREYVWKGAVFGGVLTALVVTAFPAWRPSIVVPRFMQKSAPVIAQTPTPRLVEVRAPQTMSISSMPATERFSRLASPAPAVASVTPSPITFEVVQVPPPAPRNIPAGVRTRCPPHRRHPRPATAFCRLGDAGRLDRFGHAVLPLSAIRGRTPAGVCARRR